MSAGCGYAGTSWAATTTNLVGLAAAACVIDTSHTIYTTIIRLHIAILAATSTSMSTLGIWYGKGCVVVPPPIKISYVCSGRTTTALQPSFCSSQVTYEYTLL
jgi:hypothetical protein